VIVPSIPICVRRVPLRLQAAPHSKREKVKIPTLSHKTRQGWGTPRVLWLWFYFDPKVRPIETPMRKT